LSVAESDLVPGLSFTFSSLAMKRNNLFNHLG
jgi:hypothetical protein